MTRKTEPAPERPELLSQVVQIYEDSIAGDAPAAIAARYGISKREVNAVVKGQAHEWLYPVYEHLKEEAECTPRKRGSAPLSEDDAIEIYRRHVEDGMDTAAIAAAAGRSIGFINNVLRGRVHHDYYHHFERMAAEAPEPPAAMRRPTPRLTDAEVLQIYRAVAGGKRQVQIEAETGIHRARISQIVRGVAYPHLHHRFRRMKQHPFPKRPSGRRLFTDRQVANIHRDYGAGRPIAEIAQRRHTSYSVIRGIIRGISYPELHPDNRNEANQ